jgi:hypothetical protein
MNTELDRVKGDLETMQKALGMTPTMGRDWVQWMKRDQWFSLWWCLPGVILIGATLMPHHPVRFGGLLPEQWAGLLVAAVMLVITSIQMRRVTARDGRPEGMIREAKRINGMTAEGLWGGVALAVQALVYFGWCRHYQIGLEPFWAGFFLVMGSSCLMAALAGRAWQLLGWAIPFLGYGLCVPLVGLHSRFNGVLLGLMFAGIALSFSIISILQIRILERDHDTH